MAQQRQQQRAERQVASTEVVGGREGARWINKRPDPEEFAEWFEQNVPLDDGMKHKDYVGGMTLIPGTEKVKHVKGMDSQGLPVIGEKEQLSFVPYPKVEARLSYFWRLMEHRSKDWHGLIKPVLPAEAIVDETAIGKINQTLRPGFWILPVPVGEAYTYFICYTCAVRVYQKPIQFGFQEITDAEGVTTRKRIILDEPIREGEATKQVALVKRWGSNPPYADDTALMRAETGAKGRALGMAGILIVPGSSIATAEDMLEGFGGLVPATAEAQTQAEDAGSGEKLPVITTPQTGAEKAEQTREEIINEARALLQELHDQHSDTYTEFLAWSRAKNPPVRNIADLDGPALRGCLKKLQTFVKDAREKAATVAAQDASAEAPDAAAEAPEPAPEVTPEPTAATLAPEPEPEPEAATPTSEGPSDGQ